MKIVPESTTNGQPVPDDVAKRNNLFPPIGGETPSDAAPPDPFDPSRFRLGQDFAATVGVKKVLTVVPARKPHRQEFVRVRPGEEWRLHTGLFEDKTNGDVYLVERSLWGELSNEVYPACLFLTISRQETVFLWPAKLPGLDGRSNSWNESALAGAKLAETQWVRLSSNKAASLYDVNVSAGQLSEPVWPELPFKALLRLCFKDRHIATLDHPIFKSLRGEV